MAAVALAGAFVIAMLFMASYVGALHNPLRTPHRLAMAVAGPPRVAGQYRAALRSTGGGGVFAVRTEPSLPAARTAVLDHDVYGALVPAPQGATRLIVADASGPNVADQLAARLTRGFQARRQRLTVQHVAKLPAGDSEGISSFYAGVSWVFGGYLGAIVLGVLAGAATSRLRWATLRVGGLGVYAIACGALGAVILGPAFGALTGHFLALWAVGTLIVFAVAVITSGLQGLLGYIGTGIALLLFLVASNPSAGGAVVFPALPGFWRTIGPLLPTGAGTTLVRNTVYFGAHHLAPALWVLGIYALIGVLLTLLAGARHYDSSQRDLSVGIASAGAGAG
ncbi:MAG: DUF3533 domain-containing protein [Solirubrobacteraceae bacterium]